MAINHIFINPKVLICVLASMGMLFAGCENADSDCDKQVCDQKCDSQEPNSDNEPKCESQVPKENTQDPENPENDDSLCAVVSCPAEQICHPKTGKCVSVVDESSCREDEKPENADSCRCFDSKWYCIPSTDVPPVEDDKCKDVKCRVGEQCNAETGKCIIDSFVVTCNDGYFCIQDKKTQKNIQTQLRGFNLGLWLSRSIWGLPIQKIEYDDENSRPSINSVEIIEALKNRDFTDEQINDLSEQLYLNFITTDDLDELENLGVNLVRVPFEWNHLMTYDESNNTYSFLTSSDEQLFRHMDWIVRECSKRGIYVIFDLHIGPGNLNGGGHRGDEGIHFLEDTHRKAINRIWARMSNHFKDEPTVAGYDLVNEPDVPNSEEYGEGPFNKAKTLVKFYDELYETIRDTGDEHIIFMEEDCVFCGIDKKYLKDDVEENLKDGFSARVNVGYLPDPTENGWKNVAYSVHNYYWNNQLICKEDADYCNNCENICKNWDDNDTCMRVCGNSYYDENSDAYIPPNDVIQNRIDVKLGKENDKMPESLPGNYFSILAVRNQYKVPIYVGEFNSMFDASFLDNCESNETFPVCLERVVNNSTPDNSPLKIWEYEMSAYDNAGLSYTAWTYKSSGIYWQSLMYWGSREDVCDEKGGTCTIVNLTKHAYDVIMKFFARTSSGMYKNGPYRKMFENHFKKK